MKLILRRLKMKTQTFFRQLICRPHDYEMIASQLFDAGRAKIYIYKCKKCDKPKFKII